MLMHLLHLLASETDEEMMSEYIDIIDAILEGGVM